MDQNHDTRVGTVYFFRDYAGGAIKIGHSTNPAKRWTTLQIGQPYPLMPMGTCPGSKKLERELHKEFDALRLLGEWFVSTDELVERIKHLCDDYVSCLKQQKRMRRIAIKRGYAPRESTFPATKAATRSLPSGLSRAKPTPRPQEGGSR